MGGGGNILPLTMVPILTSTDPSSFVTKNRSGSNSSGYLKYFGSFICKSCGIVTYSPFFNRYAAGSSGFFVPLITQSCATCRTDHGWALIRRDSKYVDLRRGQFLESSGCEMWSLGVSEILPMVAPGVTVTYGAISARIRSMRPGTERM